MNKETFIPSWYWQLSYDFLSIVDWRVKNQKKSGASQPLMNLGSTDPDVFPTYGLSITWTNESCLLGKPVWVGFSVLSTECNQVEAKVLTGFLLSYSYCASDGVPVNEHTVEERAGLWVLCTGPQFRSAACLPCELGSFPFFSDSWVFICTWTLLVCSQYGTCTSKLYVCYWGNRVNIKENLDVCPCWALSCWEHREYQGAHFYLSGRFS